MTKIYPISVLAILGMIAAAIMLSGGQFVFFLSVASAIMVVGITTALTLASHRPAEIASAFRAAFSGGNGAELRASVAFFTSVQHYLLWSGFLSTLLGAIVLLGNLGTRQSVGAGTAVALITVFYAIVLVLLVTLPAKAAAQKRLASEAGGHW